MKKFITQIFAFFLFLVFLSGCVCDGCGVPATNGSGFHNTTVTLDSSNGGIADGQAETTLLPNVLLKFSTPMVGHTVNPTTVSLILPDSSSHFISRVENLVGINKAEVSGTVIPITDLTEIDDTHFLFQPKSELNPSTKYLVIVKGALAKNSALVFGQFSFTTGTTATPSVSMITPNDDATGVSTSPNIQLQFSTSVINVNSTNISLHQGSVTGPTVLISSITAGSNNTYTFSPISQLANNSPYYVVVGSGVTDTLGNPVNASNFHFTTAALASPNVSIITPVNNATGVSTSPSIQLQFSTSVSNVTTTTVTLHQGTSSGPTVAISTPILGATNTYTFSSNSALSNLTTYVVVVSNGVTDATTNVPLIPNNFTFTTGASTNPTVNMTIPTNNATGVSTTTNITLAFSAAVTGVSGSNIELKVESTGVVVPITAITAGSGNTYTFAATSPLGFLESYTVVVSSGITATVGGQPVLPTSFHFTTRGVIAYIPNSFGSTGTIFMCNVDFAGSGGLSGCANAGASSNILGPVGITLNKTQNKGYIVSGDNDQVFTCPINSNGTFGTCSSISLSSSNFVVLNQLVFNPDESTAYVAAFGIGFGSTRSKIAKCDVNPTTGALSGCVNTAVNSGNGLIIQATGIVLNNSGTVAYIPEANPDETIWVCSVNTSTGALSSNCSDSGADLLNVPSAHSSGDIQVSRLLLNHAGTKAYVSANKSSLFSSTPDGALYICDVSPTTGLLSGCVDSGASLPAVTSVSDMALNREGTLMYVSDIAGVGNNVFICNVNQTTGALSGCVNSGGTGFTNPYAIAVTQ